MSDDIIMVDFYDADEYHYNEYPETLYTISGTVPIPDIDDTVTFGWKTIDGERQESVTLEESCHNSGYDKSDEYVVVDIIKHYHDKLVTNESGETISSRAESTVSVLVEEME